MDAVGVAAWNVLKWPLPACLATVMVLVLFRSGQATALRPAAPGRRRPARRRPGAPGLRRLHTLCIAKHAGTYDRLYGSFAVGVVFLVRWWITDLALLAGAQFNAELAGIRQGRPAPTGV
ncbi:hypothetical protein [Streptomyces sp. NPDC000983]|uniref:hypothetical protein n=1 Tax=Streptomyces sp. NPDC000983 TaxID=3154373 RepID=UPI00331B84DA